MSVSLTIESATGKDETQSSRSLSDSSSGSSASIQQTFCATRRDCADIEAGPASESGTLPAGLDYKKRVDGGGQPYVGLPSKWGLSVLNVAGCEVGRKQCLLLYNKYHF